MIYISKGVVLNNSTVKSIRVMRNGMVYQMTGNEARILVLCQDLVQVKMRFSPF